MKTMRKNQDNKTGNRLTGSIITIIVLLLCLVITSSALAYATVRVEMNLFQTGIVKINLNDGNPVIEEHEFLFEPGMTVVKDFFIQNQSTTEVYFRIYMANVDGGLADVLEVTVKDGDQILYVGKASDMDKQNVIPSQDALGLEERRDLQIWFHFPEHIGNEAMDLTLSFDICADAVQTKNNPNYDFE